MQKDRQRGDGLALVPGDDVGGGRGLGHVEVAVADETPVPRGRIHLGQYGQVDAVGRDFALLERADDLVVPASEGERNLLGHVGLSLGSIRWWERCASAARSFRT